MRALSTARLHLRALRPDDAEALHAAYNDDEVMRYWHQRPRATVEETAALLEEACSTRTLWAICEAGGDEAMGHVGFPTTHLDTGRAAPFGYLLRRDAWGQGIAREASTAVIDHAFHDLGVAACELWIYDGNKRSVHLAERLGAVHRGAFWGYNLELREPRRTHVWSLAGPNPLPPEVVRVIPVLSVPDVAAAVAWWCDELGFSVEWSVGDPPVSASVVSPGFPPEAASVRFRLGEATTAHLAFAVPLRFDELAERLGVDPVAQPWGMRELSRTDPWGTTVVFETPG
jgi:RimJ/RimL family protein N-acetyltransferase/catechol 2,3-dioxygenase-like lactoylglutathione lyase family enzyme